MSDKIITSGLRVHICRSHMKRGNIMRDLKHLIYFESLLQEANNALVKQACSEGKLALAYNCSYIPEPLLDIEGCFGVRLRAPGCTNPDLATYYMTNRSCPYSKSILERAFEGGYNFISALIGQECCTTMNRMEQYFEYCKLIPNEKFFTACIDMPIKKGDWYAGYFRRQIEKKILTPMKETYGVDYSEEKLMDAIERHNEICRLITEIGSYRKLDNPTITGYEFHVIQLVTLVCPKYLIVDKLRETAEELKTREPDEKHDYRAKVMLVGSEIDDPEFTKLVEMCGARVVADRYCFGSLPGREQIEIREGESALTAVARHYLSTSECPRFMNKEKQVQRRSYLKQLVNDYDADGILYLQMKFCEYWSYERVMGVHDMNEVEGIPCIGVEKEYTMASAGQLRTRFQAFVESIEIKKLQGGKM